MGRELTSARAIRREEVENCPESTGFLAPVEQPEGDRGAASRAPLSGAWMTDARVEQTRRVWSKAYGRVVTAEEAVEILMNVRRLATVLVEASREGDAK